MLEILGLVFIGLVTFFGVFVLAFAYMDRKRLWADAGLAAFIPLGGVSFVVATLATVLVMWGLT